MNFAEMMFAYATAETEFSHAMVGAGFGDYTHAGGDEYDYSIEFYGVGNDARMNDIQQRVVFDAGFAKTYVNHKDGWQTHYTWDRRKPFKPTRGWRRYMEHDAEPGPGGVIGFSVMKISYWPDSWVGSRLEQDLAAGKIVIVPDAMEPAVGTMVQVVTPG